MRIPCLALIAVISTGCASSGAVTLAGKIRIQQIAGTLSTDPKMIGGDNLKPYLEPIKAMIERRNIRIIDMSEYDLDYTPKKGTVLWGYADIDRHYLFIDNNIGTNAVVATLLHEFGHFLQPIKYTDANASDGQAFAEAISVLVCEKLGLDISKASYPYMVTPEFEYEKTLQFYAPQIDAAVAMILKELGK